MMLALYSFAFTPTGTQDFPPTRVADTSVRLSIRALAVASLVLAFLVLCSLVAVTASASVGPGNPGSSDTVFDANAVPVGGAIRAIATQSDGKVIAAGDYLARFNANGTLDTTFGSGGYVAGAEGRYGVDVQSNGDIVVGGGNFVRRFTANGTPDTAFNANTAALALDDWVGPVLQQTGGKLVVGGAFAGGLKRLNADGTLDTSFGTSGTAVGLTHPVYAMTADPTGALVIVGGGRLSRYSADGVEDATFNANVLATALPTEVTSIYSVGVQSDRKVVIGCWCAYNVKRFNADGTWDAAFNTNVAALALGPGGTGDGNYSVNGLAIQNDGRIIIGGKFGSTLERIRRINGDGTLDATFGSNGSTDDVLNEVWALRIHSGKLIAGTGNGLVRFNLEAVIGPAFPASEAPATANRTTQGAAASVPLGPTNVQWTRNSVRTIGAVGASFDAAADTSYQITATLQSAKLVQSRAAKTVRGSCVIATKKKTKRRVTTCTIRLRKPGTWLVAITPLKAGILGTPTTKLVKVKKPAKRAVRILLARHA
jgi:uncharacterized delta-60 repeat protein